MLLQYILSPVFFCTYFHERREAGFVLTLKFYFEVHIKAQYLKRGARRWEADAVFCCGAQTNASGVEIKGAESKGLKKRVLSNFKFDTSKSEEFAPKTRLFVF